MKTIACAFASLLLGVAMAFSKEEPLKPQDQLTIGEFAREAVLDSQEQFLNIEKKLIKAPATEPLRDQKFEVLIDFVWKIDKPRALKLLDHVNNKVLREKIRRYYQRLDNATRPPETV